MSKKKILNAALVLLMASFLLEKFVSFPYSKKIIEYLVIFFMTLIINISEGQGEPIINDGSKETIIITMKMQMIWLMKEIMKLFHLNRLMDKIKIN